MKLTDKQIEQIVQSSNFNGMWWKHAAEGEPVSQDEISEVMSLVTYLDQLLADRQAWKEEATKEGKRMCEQWRRAVVVESQLNQAVEVLEYYAFNHDYGERARAFLSSLEGGKP